MDAIEKKFQSMVHHHKNVVKSAQHHRLAPGALPHDVLDEILNQRVLSVARKRNIVSFVNYTSDLFQVEVCHLYDPKTSLCTFLSYRMPTCSSSMNFCHFNFSANVSITPDVGLNNLLAIEHTKSFQTICSTDLHTCLHLRDKFEKVLPSLTLPGQRRSYPDHMQIQGSGSFRSDFGTSRKHLCSLLHRNNQHEPGMPGQEHDPDMPDQLRRYSYSGTRLLHPNQGSRDLGRRTRDN